MRLKFLSLVYNKDNTMNIKDKIQKMLELAKRAGTEEESATAMRMVLQSLAKHNLDMSDIENEEEQEEDVVQLSVNGGKQAWQELVWISISSLYFCRVFSSRRNRDGKFYKTFVLIGRKSNVDAAQTVISYLIELGKELSAGVGGALYRNSFKLGYSCRISDRCEDEKSRVTNVNLVEYASMAPAIINLYAVTKAENEDFLDKLNLNLKNKTIAPQYRDEQGYRAGVEAGSKVSLKSAPAGRLE